MTARELIEMLQQGNLDREVRIYDPDEECICPVTGCISTNEWIELLSNEP